jgi:hypothetical protein
MNMAPASTPGTPARAIGPGTSTAETKETGCTVPVTPTVKRSPPAVPDLAAYPNFFALVYFGTSKAILKGYEIANGLRWNKIFSDVLGFLISGWSHLEFSAHDPKQTPLSSIENARSRIAG